jgi:hypothetical protein
MKTKARPKYQKERCSHVFCLPGKPSKFSTETRIVTQIYKNGNQRAVAAVANGERDQI